MAGRIVGRFRADVRSEHPRAHHGRPRAGIHAATRASRAGGNEGAGLSAYDSRRSLAGHLMPTSVSDVGAPPQGLRRRQPARGGVRRQRRAGLEHEPDHGCRGRGGGERRDRADSGVAGLLAGALSMAAGEYVSMRSQREMFEYQIGLERDELHEVSGRGSRGTGADLPGARDAARRGTARERELVKNEANALRCTRTRGARPEPRRSRLAVGRGDLVVPRVRRGRGRAARTVRVRPAARARGRRRRGGRGVRRCSAWARC